MNGSVTYEGSTLLSGAINVNAVGNIEALNVQVTENGTRTIEASSGVDGYSPITIETNVPIPEPVLDSIAITQNGTYTPPSGTDGYNEISVNVPVPVPVLDSISITENGTYTPPTGTDGYNEISVNVPAPVLISKTITENGTYTPPSGVDGYDVVNVDVPLPENAYLLKEVANLPQPIATFTDGTDNPLKSLTVSIEPVQAGSGDPSPTNVRPISGWTACNVVRTGKNLWDRDNIRRGVYTNSDGTTQSASASTNFSSQFIKIKPNTIYSITMFGESYENGSLFGVYYDEYKNGIKQTTNIQTLISNNSKTFTTPLNAHYIVFSGYRGVGTDIFTTANTVVCEGTPTTYTIPFTDGQGQSVEVFGGSVDVVNGVVTPCTYYGSYNGEQLTGEWISDRDVYSPNTTPTTGAQVVNIGATGTPFNTQPTAVKSLDGVNNVSASTGQIETLEYFTS